MLAVQQEINPYYFMLRRLSIVFVTSRVQLVCNDFNITRGFMGETRAEVRFTRIAGSYVLIYTHSRRECNGV